MGRRQFWDIEKDILNQSMEIFEDRDAESSRAITNLLEDMEILANTGLQKGSRYGDSRLYTGLAAAYALFSCANRCHSRVLRYVIANEDRKPRARSNPAVRFTKLCFPNWDRRSLSRFGKVLSKAAGKHMSPLELYTALSSGGGVRAFIDNE